MTDPMDTHRCTLCCSTDIDVAFVSNRRTFLECAVCKLWLVPKSTHLPVSERRERYLRHANHIDDTGYVRFLRRLYEVLRPNIHESMVGLDFGCGTAPAMESIFANDGFRMRSYDPLFAPELPVPRKGFDFITCCEVVEHFEQPAEGFAQLRRLLSNEGWLAASTGLRDGRDGSWWYLRDYTHVSFYSRATFAWIADAFNFRVMSIEQDVILLRATS